ncbi:Dinucleoside triphosphate hydrolase [Marasmius crinis-equi]|uniref:Dinucleoside triphosphate hydrolase n=1 Tax=Marasmius crinis-equi TaxID=585013 RepID=A0ABR3FZN2_9AGAR
MTSVQRVGRAVERAYGADALTVACQDGKAAGQSVPHVHFHILPRKATGDKFSENNDAIYPELEKSEGSLGSDLERNASGFQPLKVDADESRAARTPDEMEQEANWLRGFFKDT